MLRDDQKSWLQKLSDTNEIKIVPHNPNAQVIFDRFKLELQTILGKDTEILFRGANSLGISGQGDIDIYIPVLKDQFDSYLYKLIRVYGEPDSISKENRARFNRKDEGLRVEVMLVNNISRDWKDSEFFWNYLKNNPKTLKKYEEIKAKANGVSSREYYRRKIEFINEILFLIEIYFFEETLVQLCV